MAKLLTMKPDQSKRPLWLQLLGLALAVHLVFSVQRIETKALIGRLDEIAEWKEKGAIEFHFGSGTETARTVQFLADNTRKDALILRKGTTRGLIEHAAALLAPRLLYEITATESNATEKHGRPFAKLGEGILVLVAVDKETLRLELR